MTDEQKRVAIRALAFYQASLEEVARIPLVRNQPLRDEINTAHSLRMELESI